MADEEDDIITDDDETIADDEVGLLGILDIELLP